MSTEHTVQQPQIPNPQPLNPEPKTLKHASAKAGRTAWTRA